MCHNLFALLSPVSVLAACSGAGAVVTIHMPLATHLCFYTSGVEKFVGTSFIGVSPEFELALYTMAFLSGDEENEISLDTGGGEYFDLNVKCHTYDRGTKVDSSYVEALAHYEE